MSREDEYDFLFKGTFSTPTYLIFRVLTSVVVLIGDSGVGMNLFPHVQVTR